MKVLSYFISLDIDFAGKKYRGSEKVILESDSDGVELDSVNLDIHSVKVNGEETGFNLNKEAGSLRVEDKIAGKKSIEIEFSAEISNTLRGFYLARNTLGDEMLTTQFESTGARRTFPCIDKPDAKAEFTLEINIPADLEAISNMLPEKEEKIDGGRKKVIFGRTPVMSTYLLYIGIGKFSRLDGTDGRVSYSLVSLSTVPPTSSYPVDVAKKCVAYFNEYFGIDYALPKMDLIAVPQFAAGAMENWGAITFREMYVLTNKNTSFRLTERTAEIIAHEITHQWFGDLVTMKWWNDLWLNESFATFMGVKATDHYFPEWNPFEYYFELRQGPALLGDSLQSSHPIDVDVTDPDTISQIFDEISYGKGSSILRMFEAYVGADNFRNGIRSYLAKHKYGNAEGRDLWEEVEKASGLEVGRIMSAWIKREGYPVVTVRREGNSLKLIQERFLLGGKSEEMPWPIPVEIRVGDESKYHLFEGRETSIEANGDFVINPERKGFYRIFYDEPMEITLSRVRGMSEFEQWGIVSDFYAFLQSGRVNLKTYLSVVNATQGSQYKMPYLIAADQLFHLSVLYPDISEIRDFAVSYLKTALPNIKKLAETDGKYRDLEGKIMSRLATLDMEFARTIAVEFERFESVNPDLRLSIALAYARSEKNMERMMQVLESLDNDEDRTKIISALGWIDMPDAMDNVAKHIEEGKIKKQDIATYYYVQAIANPYNRDELFKRIPGIVSRVSEIFVGGIQGSRLVELSISTLGATRRNDALKLSDSLKNPKVSMGLAKGLELLEINARTYEQIKAAN